MSNYIDAGGYEVRDLRDEIKQMVYPVRLPTPVMDLISVKMHDLYVARQRRREEVENDKSESAWREISSLPAEDQKVIKNFLKAKAAYDAARVPFDAKFAYVMSDNKNVQIKETPEVQNDRYKRKQARLNTIDAEFKQHANALVEVAMKMAKEQIQQVRVKVPQELLAELDNIGTKALPDANPS